MYYTYLFHKKKDKVRGDWKEWGGNGGYVHVFALLCRTEHYNVLIGILLSCLNKFSSIYYMSYLWKMLYDNGAKIVWDGGAILK